MGTANLGRHARRGAGILIMGISGGAVFPPIQGIIADRYSTRISFLVPMVGFIIVLAYALSYWIRNGLQIKRSSRSATDNHAVIPAGADRMTVDNTFDVQISLSRPIMAENTANQVSDSSPFLLHVKPNNRPPQGRLSSL
ncbi:unnamed protein product [Rotaria sordida]|uniref:Major facilitator superfamily (MFS) profile domain-containing protein n=1 Tax=Rotaria sordida TaxID=392033 RepID=A0A814GPH9_9BILA|nr:unnamed protein product [Rotaria sordida]CAF0998972.1 unnamed protein product [Rotaria sordida]CAF3849703.1 unnamed protein product [Rotaria sordida]